MALTQKWKAIDFVLLFHQAKPDMYAVTDISAQIMLQKILHMNQWFLNSIKTQQISL